jgi:hypothetical protein
MWTPITRRQHSREHLPYGGDLTDAECALIASLLPPAGKTDRPGRNSADEIAPGGRHVIAIQPDVADNDAMGEWRRSAQTLAIVLITAVGSRLDRRRRCLSRERDKWTASGYPYPSWRRLRLVCFLKACRYAAGAVAVTPFCAAVRRW